MSIIFTAMMLSICFAVDSFATNTADIHDKDYGSFYIDDCIKANIASQYERLNESKLDLPYHYKTNLTRQNEYHSCRRIHDNTKSGYANPYQIREDITYPLFILCNKVVATSRHERGYYIYALRHIII